MADMGFELMQILCDRYPNLIESKFGIKIEYDEDKISYEEILNLFFEFIDFSFEYICA